MKPQRDIWSRAWLVHALWGTLGFAVLCAQQPLTGLRAVGGIGYLLVFAALVIVPLGVSMATKPRCDGTTAWTYKLAALTHAPAAIAAVAALILPAGTVTAAIACSWLLQTLLLAGFGIYRLACHGLHSLDELAIDVGLLQLPIGAAWWVATCAGWRFGFSDLIVQLTVIHFHYAGFAAPVICGLTGRGIDPGGRLRRGYQVACWTVMLAVWIVATGIGISSLPFIPALLSRATELAGAALLASGMILLATLLCLHLPRRAGRLAGTLLVVAGISLAVPMALAVAYASGRLFGWPLLTIPEMARWHGFLNAFGFAGAGLTAFALWRPKSRRAAPG